MAGLALLRPWANARRASARAPGQPGLEEPYRRCCPTLPLTSLYSRHRASATCSYAHLNVYS